MLICYVLAVIILLPCGEISIKTLFSQGRVVMNGDSSPIISFFIYYQSKDI